MIFLLHEKHLTLFKSCIFDLQFSFHVYKLNFLDQMRSHSFNERRKV